MIRTDFSSHVKNRLKQHVGGQFYPLIDQRLIPIGSTLVLWVACKPSKRPAFYDDDVFYVRTTPATDELKGRRMHEYIQNHFKRDNA